MQWHISINPFSTALRSLKASCIAREGIIDLGLIQYAIDAKMSAPTLPLTLYLWHKSTHQDVWIANDNLSLQSVICRWLHFIIHSNQKLSQTLCLQSLHDPALNCRLRINSRQRRRDKRKVLSDKKLLGDLGNILFLTMEYDGVWLLLWYLGLTFLIHSIQNKHPGLDQADFHIFWHWLYISKMHGHRSCLGWSEWQRHDKDPWLEWYEGWT